MKREAIDFHVIEPAHLKVHIRLENWAQWSYNSGGGSAAPMFRLYRSDEHWERAEPSIPVDHLCAADMQKGVSNLPRRHAEALQWNYVRPGSPRREAQRLGESIEGLYYLVRTGRQMLINRGFETFRAMRIDENFAVVI